MRFNLANPLSCGNAVRFVLSTTADEVSWRLLRKEAGTGVTFSGQADTAAFLVHDGTDLFLTDSRLLVNGVEYIYALYGESVAGVWGDPVYVSVTPEATFEDQSIDPQELVRERIDVSLHSMIQRSKIVLSQSTIPVMSIPFYTQGGTFPVVTVLYGNGASSVRGLGELLSQDEPNSSDWVGSQGWLSGVTLEISAWSLNAEERNTLRKALQAVIAANLNVLEEQGLDMVEVQSISDTEDTQSMNAPIYQTTLRLSCQVSVAVTDAYGSFVDVTANRIEV
jgi:hypothetical protein